MRYRFDAFELDTDRELLSGPEGPVPLRRQTFRLLHLLIERAPTLVSRDDLMDVLWGHHALSPNVIPQTISELRQALGDDAQTPRFIETRHRRGYVFIASIERLDPSAITTSPAPRLADESGASTPVERLAEDIAPAILVARPVADVPATGSVQEGNADGAVWSLDTGSGANSVESGGIASIDLAPGSSDEVVAELAPAVERPSGKSVRWLVPALTAALSLALLASLWWIGRTPGARIDLASSSAAASSVSTTELYVQSYDLRHHLALRLQGDPRWMVLPDGIEQTAGMATWSILVDANGHWHILDPVGAQRATSQLQPGEKMVASTEDLLRQLGEASGVSTAAVPDGWPRTEAGLSAIRTVALEMARGKPVLAASAIDKATNGKPQGWARLALAEALIAQGDRSAAHELLEEASATSNTFLRLATGALRASLTDRPAELLAALRAQALLAPGSVAVQLSLLDAQLAQSQWQAASETLNSLDAMLGGTTAALGWRRAQWLSVTAPANAGAAWTRAIELAEKSADANVLRDARLAYATWLSTMSRRDEALKQLSALPEDDPAALALRADIVLQAGDLDTAQTYWAKALESAIADGRLGDARRARLGTAERRLASGDAEGAASAIMALLVELEASGDKRLAGHALTVLGQAQIRQGDFVAARRSLTDAMSQAEERDDPRAVAIARFHFGNALAQERRPPSESIEAYRLAAEAFHHLQDRLWEAKALSNLALMSERSGRRLEAKDAYADTLTRIRELGLPRELGRVLLNAAINDREMGQLDGVGERLDEAMQALERAGARDVQTFAAAVRADIALAQADLPTAQRALSSVAAFARNVGQTAGSSWLTASARLEELAGRPERAAAMLEESAELRRDGAPRAAQLDVALRQLRLKLVDSESAVEQRVTIEGIESEFLRINEPKYAIAAALAAIEARLVAGETADALRAAEALTSRVHESGNRAQQLQRAWLTALASEAPLRERRLDALEKEARDAGFRLLARMAACERQSGDTAAADSCRRALAADGLPGALSGPVAAF